MPPLHHTAWPTFTIFETAMLVWFSANGFELPDTARIIESKLHRPARFPLSTYIRHMDRFNQNRAQRGLPPLCSPGMAWWDLDAVRRFLLEEVTDNSDWLEGLLWFYEGRYVPLLDTWRRNNVPLRDVLNVPHLRYQLATLIRQHRAMYSGIYRFYV